MGTTSVTKYDLGDLVRCTGTFTNAAGAAVDPTAVIFAYRKSGGTLTTLTYGTDAEVVKSATGVYYVDLDVDAVGVWHYRFYSTGTGQAADEGAFSVASRF